MQATTLAVLIVSLAAGLALSACAGAARSANEPATSSGSGPAPGSAPQTAAADAAPATVAQRELAPEEKKAIMDAVTPNLKDPKSAKYHWVKFPAVVDDSATNYCATVDANSPYAPYDGHQAYIVAVQMLGGRVNSATMGLIAGGKDAALVSKMCAKYGLDPNKSS